jgi:hypothetical protein
MALRVDSRDLTRAANAVGLRTRAICVIQRDGVATVRDVQAYIARSAEDGFAEVCFKELYVSSLRENAWARNSVNRHCEDQRIPLSIVVSAVERLGFERTAMLPWGSPVYSGEIDGRPIRVAAYTEPSVGWERTHGLVRSWNAMADGTCLASLEDPSSTIELP